MNWSDLKGIIGTAAPILGTLVGGPAGAVVGKLIASGLGLNGDATPGEVNNLLQSNPDAFVKLQQIEADNKVQLQQLQVTAANNQLLADNAQYAAEAADRDSARKLAAQQPTDYTRQILTYLLTGLVGMVVWYIFSGRAIDLLKDSVTSLTIGTVLGYLFNEFKQVLGFWFGATREGQKQTSAITDFAVSPGAVTAATPDTTTVTTPAAVNVEPTAPELFKGH